MALSSNTVIHFTSSKEALKGILTENFKVKYCKETIRWKDDVMVFHAPMVSFCDIPLSQIKAHISQYGHYGIGLSRAWAIANKLNPVLYIEPESSLSNSLHQLVSSLAEPGVPIPKGSAARMLDILRYIKNYEGPLVHGEKNLGEYRFSDEREWRYVPDVDRKNEMVYADSAFTPEIRAKASQSLVDLRLNFEPNDVKYIVIKDDDEIGEFIEHLRKAKGKTYAHADVERLSTRILTSEQIHKDI